MDYIDEHNVLHNQIDRLTEIMDRVNTRLQGRQNQQPRPYKPYIQRGRGHRNFLSYNRGKGN